MSKNFKLYGLALFFFVSVSVVFAGISLAETSESGGGIACDPAKFTFRKYQDSFVVSLLATTLLHSAGVSDVKPWFTSFGASPAESMGCGNYIVRNTPGVRGTNLGNAILSQNCPDTDESICRSITNQFELGGGDREIGAVRGYDSEGFANSKVAGSLLGYAYLVQNTVTYEPVPVNMAYFFKDYAAKLPIIGDSVYAANTTEYGHTLINSVLGLWKIFRNIAYAMMSLIMLWVGFAIITRKKISSQTVVNVQYAMPKIVIALIMIAFSYPIGALITSLSWTLWNNALSIISSVSSGALVSGGLSFAEMANSTKQLGIGGLVLLIQKVSIGVGGVGSLLYLLPLLGIVIIGFALFASLKALWIYIKMVISIATSPLQIALYALPGQDDKLEMWLKQMLSWGIGLFGMAMVYWLTLTFSLSLIVQTFTITGSQWKIAAGKEAIVSGSLFNVFIVPLIIVFGLATSIKVPNMVEEMIMDKKGGKR